MKLPISFVLKISDILQQNYRDKEMLLVPGTKLGPYEILSSVGTTTKC